MRVVGEIAHPVFKITVYAWNGKYVVKFETGNLEQIYKIPDYEVVGGDHSLKDLLTSDFYQRVDDRFKQMLEDLNTLLG